MLGSSPNESWSLSVICSSLTGVNVRFFLFFPSAHLCGMGPDFKWNQRKSISKGFWHRRLLSNNPGCSEGVLVTSNR